MDVPEEAGAMGGAPASAAVRAAVDVMLHVDHAFVRVPLEQLGRAVRAAEKLAEKDLASAAAAVDELAARAASATPEQRGEVLAQLATLATRLQTLRRKLSEVHAEQDTYAERVGARLDVLHRSALAFEGGRVEEVQQWLRQRFDRTLVDHLLREGFYQTAAVLTEQGGLGSLVDVDMFLAARRVEDSLRGRSCTEALAWCSENRSRLRKLKSTLEFNLRMQEYIELVRGGRYSNAITYARKHLTQWMDTNAKDVQKALALLAFPSHDTRCERYRQLYDPARWQTLAEQFRSDNFQLYSLTSQSLLTITLQGGLSALKTPMCYELESKTLNCPVCNAQMGQLARTLPHAHHAHSSIVCRLSGALMDPDNPPMMLPNGNVYSTRALESMNASQGAIVDPRTGERYRMSELRKVFVM